MSDKVQVALAGIAGYGDLYLDALLNDARAASVEFVGAVDPMPERCKRLGQLSARQIRIHPDLPSLYSESIPDLVMMATPIHLHAPHARWCLEHQTHVLCEKPLASTVRDARRLVSAEMQIRQRGTRRKDKLLRRKASCRPTQPASANSTTSIVHDWKRPSVSFVKPTRKFKQPI